jgi:hypothetical protein
MPTAMVFPVRLSDQEAKRHENIGAIQAAATMELTDIQKEAFTSCFQDLQKRWQQCIDCGGNYFERDRKHCCEVEFCIFYRLSLRTLRTKEVVHKNLPFQRCFRF